MARYSANEGQRLETIEKKKKGNRKCTITDEQIKQLKIIKKIHTPKFVLHIFQATKQSME